jgi:hypothetical protein
MLETVVAKTQKSKERQEENIETVMMLVSSMLHMIGRFRRGQKDLTEDEAKKGMQYLDDSRKMSEAIGDEETVELTIAKKHKSDTTRHDALRGLGLTRRSVHQKQWNNCFRGIEMPIRWSLKELARFYPSIMVHNWQLN